MIRSTHRRLALHALTLRTLTTDQLGRAAGGLSDAPPANPPSDTACPPSEPGRPGSNPGSPPSDPGLPPNH